MRSPDARPVGVPLRPVVVFASVLWLLAPPAARALELPVRDPAGAPVSGPAYVADLLSVRLAPTAALRARAAREPGQTRADAALPRLGVPALDAAAAALGAWFEPEFRGETPPPAGSSEPDFTAFYIAHLPPAADLEGALTRLRGLAEVQSAEPVAVLPVSAVPNDSLWTLSWWHDQPSGHDIHSLQAWGATTGDTSLVIAILDTGVLPYHPDLGGTQAGLAGQMWTNWSEKGGVPGVDDDGNGFVDDVRGWDFVNVTVNLGNRLPFEDYADPDSDPNDYAGHGTLVAGLAGAIADNGIGVAGTAWRVRLMPVRIGWAETTAPLGLVNMTFVAQAVRYATRMGANVINCSFASIEQSDLTAALDAAIRAGVTVVVAAGNGGSRSDIGLREDVIAVAATTSDDYVWGLSNLGGWVDLAAPGAYIYSTFVAPAETPTDSLTYRQPAYDTPAGSSGTSFSAPLVAGAVVLLQARQKSLGLRPLTPRGALLRLRETTDDIGAINAPTAGYGTGRLNLYRALTDRLGSTAWRAGASSVGPAIPIPLSGPARKLTWVTSNARLVIEDWRLGDTLALVTLPGVPARQLAAADLGGGHGVGLFVGTQNGALAGYDTTGAALAGFPVTTTGGTPALGGGPALGDLDGDGVLEIVCGANDGRLWAWRANGAVVPGFPVATDASGVTSPVALTELDGRPGVEIVAAAAGGRVYAFRGDGGALPGWPATTNPGPRAPVVARFGRDTVVLVAAAAQLIGLRPDGSERLRWTLPGTAVKDPALGDLDGDGTDEAVVPVSAPNQLAVLDSSGVPLAGLGWPVALTATPLGPPVLGQLQGPGPPGIVIMQTGGLVAFSDSAQSITLFPKPGGAGTFPTLEELAGDGATKIAAGSGFDSLLYVYDAGAGSAAATPQAWPVPRGNLARTGSHLYLSPDALAPARVSDLAAGSVPGDSLRLTWTAPGDDGGYGRAAAYELRVTTFKPQAGSADGGNAVEGLPVPGPAGDAQRVTLAPAEPGATCWIWLRTRDEAGNTSGCSNVLEWTRPLGPARPAEAALAARQQPARVPVLLDWGGAEATSIRLYDVTGRLVRTLWLGRGERGTVQWNGRDEVGRLVPAGLYFARLIGGSLHAQTRIVLLP